MFIPAGIQNIGNSCYLSSLIQCIRCIDPILASNISLPPISYEMEDVSEFLLSILDLNHSLAEKTKIILQGDNCTYQSQILHVDCNGKPLEEVVSLQDYLIVQQAPIGRTIISL